MEIDYTYITPEQRELYGVDDVYFSLSMVDEDGYIDESQQTLDYDIIEQIAYDLNKRSRSMEGIVSYKQYVDSLIIDDSPIKSNLDTLLVKCKYCKDHFQPTRNQVENRIRALNGYQSEGAENNFYCSKSCKKKCPIYKSHGVINKKSKRDVSYTKQAREIVLELAENKCEICGSEKFLEIHHIKTFKTDPLEAYDIDNLVVLCSVCHKEKGHSDRKCTTGYLARCEMNE